MCRKNLEEKVDWHNNAEYNRGMSANRRYIDAIFESEKGWGARFKGKMKNLVGSWGELQDNLESAAKTTKSRPAKIALGIAIGALAIGSAIYLYILNHNKKSNSLNKAA